MGPTTRGWLAGTIALVVASCSSSYGESTPGGGPVAPGTEAGAAASASDGDSGGAEAGTDGTDADAAAGGDAGGPPSCPAFAVFCDDFESGTFGKWRESTISGGAVTLVKGASPAGSSLVMLSTVSSDGGYAAMRAELPVMSSGTFAVRSYVYLSKPLAFDSGFLKLRQRTSSNEDMTLKAATAGALKVDTDTSGSGADMIAASPAPIGTWFCLEWIVTLATSGRQRLRIDDVDVVDAVEDTVGTLSGGPYDELEMGFTYSSGGSQEIRFDHVVVARQPIGCK